MKRNTSGFFWAWNTSPMASPPSSVHGGQNFSSQSLHGRMGEGSDEGSNLSARRGLGWSISLGSMLWDWKGKSSLPESREPSMHGGQLFRPETSSRGASMHGGNAFGSFMGDTRGDGLQSGYTPSPTHPRKMPSSVWSWAQSTISSPASSRDPSVHGKNAFSPSGKAKGPDNSTFVEATPDQLNRSSFTANQMYEWDGTTDNRVLKQNLRSELDEKVKLSMDERNEPTDAHMISAALKALWMPLAVAGLAVCIAYAVYSRRVL